MICKGVVLFSKRYDFSPGERVVVVAWPLKGIQGTLLRRTRLPWNGIRAWVVELDGDYHPGGKRQYIAEAGLLPLAAFRDKDEG